MVINVVDKTRPLLPNEVSVDIVECEQGNLAVEVSMEVPDVLHEEVQREADYSRSVNGYALPIEHYLLDRVTIVPQFTVDGEPLQEC